MESPTATYDNHPESMRKTRAQRRAEASNRKTGKPRMKRAVRKLGRK